MKLEFANPDSRQLQSTQGKDSKKGKDQLDKVESRDESLSQDGSFVPEEEEIKKTLIYQLYVSQTSKGRAHR